MPSSLETGELPEFYGVDRVVVMPVNPYLVHVYWELAPRHQPQTTASACLRFSEAGGPVSFDVNVDLAAKSWYVHLWSPEKRYSVELGINQPDGGFVCLARSNLVETPRAWPVAEVQEQFRRVDNSQMPAGIPVAPPPPTARPASPAAPAPPALPAPLAVPVIAAETEQALFPPPEPPASKFNPARREKPEDPSAEPSATAQETTPRDALTAEPRSLAPPDAAAVLRQRLMELYAFRWWRDRPAGISTSAAPELHLPAEVPLSQLVPPRPEAAGDLTSRVESRFSPGLSSSLLGLPGPDRPAD